MSKSLVKKALELCKDDDDLHPTKLSKSKRFAYNYLHLLFKLITAVYKRFKNKNEKKSQFKF